MPACMDAGRAGNGKGSAGGHGGRLKDAACKYSRIVGYTWHWLNFECEGCMVKVHDLRLFTELMTVVSRSSKS